MIRGSRAVRICPKVGLFHIVLGFPNRVWLKRLKASNRRSIFCASVIGKVRDNATSTFHAPGPRITPRPEFPYVPTAGLTNADVSNQREIVGSLNVGLRTRFGRSPPPVSELSVPNDADEGVPVAFVKMVDSCQLPNSFCIQVLENVGVLTTAVRLNACWRSDRQFPYSP